MTTRSRPKLIFMGSSEFAVPALEKLNKDYEIELVVVQPDKKRGRGNKTTPLPVKKKALELGLEVFQPENISSDESEAFLKQYDSDLYIVCSYGQILRDNILNLPKYGSLNIHGSLLPKYRGAAPVHRAIIDGDEKAGVTIMLLDSGMDTGPMLSKAETDISDKTTVGDLHDELAEIGGDLLVETIPLFLDDKIEIQHQNNDEATYADKIQKSEGKIDWNRSGASILRLINGTDPFPGAFIELENKKIKVFAPILLEEFSESEPGTIITNDNELKIVCGDNKLLKINEIQYPGKRRMKTEDFFRGNSLPNGAKVNFD